MMTLHGYWRSSAAYRVRIGFGLKGVDVKHVSVNLKEGEQSLDAHLHKNPQGLVPVLELEDGTLLSQSLAILDYLDTTFPEPKLMPSDPLLRSKILSAALIIAADIHPIQNLSVLKYLRREFQAKDGLVSEWVRHWIERGFETLEQIAQKRETLYLYTNKPTFFEICLIPQVYNANRFGVDMTAFPALSNIEEECQKHEAFQLALPERQHDCPAAFKLN